jgi:hypothetical protein
MLSDLKAKGEEVKAKNENQLMCALRARKVHRFIQKLHYFFLKLPHFSKENKRIHNQASEARDPTLALL